MIDGAMVVRLRTVVSRFFYQASTDWTFLTRMIFKDALNTQKRMLLPFMEAPRQNWLHLLCPGGRTEAEAGAEEQTD